MIRKFTVTPIATALLVASTTAVWTTSAIAQEVQGPKITWKYNVWGKKRAFTAGVENLAERVSDKTGGNFKIKVFYGDQLGGRKQNLDNLKAGVFEMAQICTSYHPGKNEAAMVLNLPFLPIKNADVEIAVHEAGHRHPIIRDEFAEKWNVFPFMSSILPQYEFLGKGKPPVEVTDWKGLSVRALGGMGDALEKLGARKSTLSAPEVYQAIDRGTVSAVSFPFSYAHVAYKIDEVASWFTTNMSPGTSDCPTLISLDAWNKLPAQYQKLMRDSKNPAYEALKAAYKKADDKNLPRFHEKMTAVTYSDAQLAEIRRLGAQPVWDDWVKKNQGKFDAQGLLDYILEAAKTAKAG